MVQEGIFRTTRATGRGRRRRRGEFVPVGAVLAETETREASEAASSPAADAIAELRVSEEHDDSGLVALRMRGTLELATILPFRDAAFSAIGRRPSGLVLDLKRVETIDDAGIASLVTTVRVARMLNVPFFVAPSPALRDTLEATGICRKMALVS